MLNYSGKNNMGNKTHPIMMEDDKSHFLKKIAILCVYAPRKRNEYIYQTDRITRRNQAIQ